MQVLTDSWHGSSTSGCDVVDEMAGIVVLQIDIERLICDIFLRPGQRHASSHLPSSSITGERTTRLLPGLGESEEARHLRGLRVVGGEDVVKVLFVAVVVELAPLLGLARLLLLHGFNVLGRAVRALKGEPCAEERDAL